MSEVPLYATHRTSEGFIEEPGRELINIPYGIVYMLYGRQYRRDIRRGPTDQAQGTLVGPLARHGSRAPKVCDLHLPVHCGQYMTLHISILSMLYTYM